MRVLFLQQQPCMRALKYAAGLRSEFASIKLGFAYQGKTLSGWYGSGDELFDRWWDLGSEPRKRLRAIAGEFQPDLIHSHNLPDSLTAIALELFAGGIPIVHDVHDLQSLRRTPYEHGFPEPREPLALERVVVEGCSALVTVSEELLEEIRTRYRITAPTLAFANYALRRDLPQVIPPPERRNGHPPRLVYEGTVSTNGGHYDLRGIARALVSEGVSLDIYPSRQAPAYAGLATQLPGLRVHPTLPPSRLLSVLSQYDFGWAGFNSTLNGAHLDTCLPNKVYEYIGCGLPVLTLGHRALARLITEGGLGLSLGSFDDLIAQLSAVDAVELRRRIAAIRLELTVEANIHRLTDLYETVAG
jgi:glycosyltransferase involved in cell wall biosynthesis